VPLLEAVLVGSEAQRDLALAAVDRGLHPLGASISAPPAVPPGLGAIFPIKHGHAFEGWRPTSGRPTSGRPTSGRPADTLHGV